MCDVATAQERAIIQTGGPVRSLALSPDGKIIAAGADKPSGEGVGLWDMAIGKELAFLPGHKGIHCVAYSPDGKSVASLSDWGEDKEVRLWDVASKKLRLTVVPDWGDHIAFAPDGKTLALGHEFVDVESGKQRPSPQGHVGKAYDLAMVARVNGREYSRASLADIYWSFGEMLAYASRGTTLVPGDVIGSGTCGTGCILELSLAHGADAYPWLQPGDVVELEVAELGTLHNRVVEGRPAIPLR